MSVRLRGLALALLPWSDVFCESPAHRPVWAYLWVNLHQSFWHRLQLPVSHSVTLSNALWFWWPNLVSTSFFLVLPPGFMLWYASWGDAGRGGGSSLHLRMKGHLHTNEWITFKSSLVNKWISRNYSQKHGWLQGSHNTKKSHPQHT